MPRDIPIIFSAPMVLALLAGHKTMTRRLAWVDHTFQAESLSPSPQFCTRTYPTSWQKAKADDRLWVRESFKPVHSGDPSKGARYMADIRYDQTLWRPSIHMPRWASRLTLVVTAVKTEQLQEITEAEAIAEGATNEMNLAPGAVNYATAVGHFRSIWDNLHGKKSWDSNPEVIALTFTVHKENIDALRR